MGTNKSINKGHERKEGTLRESDTTAESTTTNSDNKVEKDETFVNSGNNDPDHVRVVNLARFPRQTKPEPQLSIASDIGSTTTVHAMEEGTFLERQQNRPTQPGAQRVQGWIGSDDDSSTGSSNNEEIQEMDGRVQSDEDLSENELEVRRNADTRIEAELVDVDEDRIRRQELGNLTEASAQVLEETIIYPSKRRRQRRITLLLLFGVAILAAPVLIWNSSTRNTPSSSSLEESLPTVPTTFQPTASPTTSTPTIQPTPAPTSLSWTLLGELSGRVPDDPDVLQLVEQRDGKYGHSVDIIDMPEEFATGKRSSMVIVTYGGLDRLDYSPPANEFQFYKAAFHFCDVQGCKSGAYAELPISNFPQEYWRVSLSENGMKLAVAAEVPGVGSSLAILDFSGFQRNLTEEVSIDPFITPTTLPLPALSSTRQLKQVAISPNGNHVLALGSDFVSRYTLLLGDDDEPFFENTPIWDPAVGTNRPVAIATNDEVYVVGENKEVYEYADGFFFDGFQITVSKYDGTPIGDPIQHPVNYTLQNDHSLAVAKTGSILAYGYANYFVTGQAWAWPERNVGMVRICRLQDDDDTNNATHTEARWVQMGSILQYGDREPGRTESDHFGATVSISHDGQIVAIGAPRSQTEGENSGSVYIYQFDDFLHDWELIKILHGTQGSNFGASLKLSPSGRRLIVGAPNSHKTGPNAGEAFVFDLAGVA